MRPTVMAYHPTFNIGGRDICLSLTDFMTQDEFEDKVSKALKTKSIADRLSSLSRSDVLKLRSEVGLIELCWGQ